MACADIFDAFKYASEHLSDTIYKLAKFNDPFINAIPVGKFPENSGVTITDFQIESQEPLTDEVSWDDIDQVTDLTTTPGACAYNFNDVRWGYSEFTYSPKKIQFRGPPICRDNQYFMHSPDQFVSSYVKELAEHVRKQLSNHLYWEYVKRCPIFVAGSGGCIIEYPASATLTAPEATSELTQDMLDLVAEKLIYNRATDPDTQGFVSIGPEGPLFSLLIGSQASMRISKNNTEFRNDLRWASESILMQRLGAMKTIRNFRHVPWLLPARYTYAGGAYVRRNTFKATSPTKGNGSDVSVDWKNKSSAPYEAAVVLNPSVIEREIVMPRSTVGGVSFPEQNYSGEWVFSTGQEALESGASTPCFDPLHKMGRHFAQMMHAIKRGSNPKGGAIILFERCSYNCDLVTCS